MKTSRGHLVLTGALLAALALLSLSTPAGAQGYPGTGSITLDKTTVPQGGTVGVTCTGFAPGTDVQITLHSDPVDLGTATADDNGEVHQNITIPPGTATGQHSVTCSGLSASGGSLTLTAELMVTATGTTPVTNPTTSGTGTLPRTGSDTTELLRVGVVLIVAGAALAVIVRRRSSDDRRTRA